MSGLLTITSVAAQQSMSIIVLASHCEFKTTEAEKGVMMAACVTGKSWIHLTWKAASNIQIIKFVIAVLNGFSSPRFISK